MRLIDVDKLIDNLDAMIPDYDYSDTSMGIATAIQEAGRRAFYEEVKAIPIELIKKKLLSCQYEYENDYDNGFDKGWNCAIKTLLKDLEKENE